MGRAVLVHRVSPSPTSELEELNTAFRALSDPSPLYMALFLHDIDKPDPSHPITGAEKAERIAPEFGFNSQQTDDICFLIREHLTMIDLARYHHWDESTLAEFCKKVNSLERFNRAVSANLLRFQGKRFTEFQPCR